MTTESARESRNFSDATPWRQDRDLILDSSGEILIYGMPGTKGELIVRAVNSHAHLVATLERVDSMLKWAAACGTLPPSGDGTPAEHILDRCLREVLSVLAAAKGDK